MAWADTEEKEDERKACSLTAAFREEGECHKPS